MIFSYPENFVNKVISLIYFFVQLSPLWCPKNAFELILEHFVVAVRAGSVRKCGHSFDATVLSFTHNLVHPVTIFNHKYNL